MKFTKILLLAVCCGLLCGVGCGGGGARSAAGANAGLPAAIVVTTTAVPLTLGPGQAAQISATVANDSSGAGVTWALAAGAPGTLTTVDKLHATYTAPASFTQAATVTITATSVADGTKSASVNIALALALTVTLTANPTELGLNQASTLTASVTNDVNSAGVTFALAAGAPGTLTASDALHATYTSPASLGQTTQVQITATSVADSSQTASVTVSVNPAVSVSVAAQNTASLTALQGTLITATGLNDGGAGVSWSLQAGASGTLTPIDGYHAAYTAPMTISANGSDTVTATSLADATKTASVTVELAAPAAGSLPVWQNLVQFQNGLAWEGTSVPPYATLQTAANTGVFQSNLLIFHDTQAGTEVWRLDNDPNADTGEVGTLNRQAWDANGSHFEVFSDRCVPEVYCGGETGDLHNYIYNATASQVSLVMPMDASRSASNQNLLYYASGVYLPWDESQPGKLYVTTYDDTTQASGPNPNSSLYQVDVTNGFAATKITDLPNPLIAKGIQSYPANDGMLLVRDANASCNDSNDVGDTVTPCAANGSVPNATYIPNIYMVPTSASDPSFGTVKYSFGINFNLSQYTGLDHYVGNEYHLHDIYFRRDNNDDDFIFNYGPLGSVGEPVFFEVPVNGDVSQITVNYSGVCTAGGQMTDTPYFSHPAWNFNGSEATYFGESYCGAGDDNTHVRTHPGAAPTDGGTVVATIGNSNGGHVGWDGWDPNYVTYDGDIGAADPVTGLSVNGLLSGNPSCALASQPCTTNGNVLVYRELRNENTSPGLLYGMVQSPDATKVFFAIPEHWVVNSPTHSYVAVDHRPFPPALTATTGSGSVQLSWTPYVTHRETAGYHVYRSPQGAQAFQEISNGLVAGNCSGPSDCTFTDTGASNGQVYDYAVTAQENSGLESNQLSNVEEVTVGGGVTQQQAQGLTGWEKSAPAAPTNFTATLSANQTYMTLSWTASASSDVRYYKLYYGDGGTPQQNQAYLVATPPAGQTSWIVWQLDPATPPVFGLSAVDRQDNESPMACLQTANPGTPCH